MFAAILEMCFRPDDLEKSMETLHDVLDGTRAFPGSAGVEVLVDVEDPNRVVVIERWESLEDDEAYRSWRAGEGKTRLGSLLSTPARLTKFRSVRSF